MDRLTSLESDRSGLPSGFQERLITRSFGDHLTLHLLGRKDLIALKLYAAADERGGRRAIHESDLWLMNPTEADLNAALGWIETRQDYEQIKTSLKHLLGRQGHEDLAYYIW